MKQRVTGSRRALVRATSVVSSVVLLCVAGVLDPAVASDVGAQSTARTRADVEMRYQRFAKTLTVPVGWTGSVSDCRTGAESRESRTATVRAINIARYLVGVEPVTLQTSTAASKATSAALLMQANGALDHSPTQSEFPKCWSAAGASAASRSNLALGASGARAIAAYLAEPGSGNSAAGHRRWILNPAATQLATGSTSEANALTVFGLDAPAATGSKPAWIPWPAAGWFPQQLEPKGRWSLSATDSRMHFWSAAVRVERLNAAGAVVQVMSVKTQEVREGYGPNTVVFDVAGVAHPTGSHVVRYRVSVSGITNDATPGTRLTKTYVVSMFDAD
ncbi:CAP domain-containing protein [Cellulomonas composti]|uniref:CAP domain-containing protein n=1 Tax=Cellulomonas composti TaxID=266130 RepID=UPI0011BFC43B|nr:CAP domain-containing protein [Cellulomonas composti]